ncbi:hypothetical protein HDU78_008257 [Chytriomyces hyalinus]|nr:hypothetical protein HDU78_008257 [Chytriomyces hyalinus]KAJ3251143.1 hypothetical protein HDU77_006112 [Chytriomyces hyalinus]KAJ3389701.1 hypothetical protein HDU80_011432 [Chytriomyces hyalinus]
MYLGRLLTASSASAATFFAGDATSQVVMMVPGAVSVDNWDVERTAKTALFGVGMAGWYGLTTSYLLSRVFQSQASTRLRLHTAVLHAITQQALFAPPLTFSFLYARAAFVNNDPMPFQTAEDTFKQVSSVAWTFLPASNVIANWAIRSHVPRRVFVHSVGLAWATYLSVQSHAGPNDLIRSD